jgi:hypothetical protein
MHYYNFHFTFFCYYLKVNMFCALSQQKVFGPVFSAESTITGAYSLSMLGNWLWSQLRVDILQDLIHIQQDGALLHFHRKVWQSLDEQVPGCWIGRAGQIPWPARQPDPNPLDFFFWGYVKEHVYIPPLPKTVNKLHHCISECSYVTENMADVWMQAGCLPCYCRWTYGKLITSTL